MRHHAPTSQPAPSTSQRWDLRRPFRRDPARPRRGPRFRRTRAAARALSRGMARAGRAVADYALAVTGLALISAAGFTVHRALGLLVAGVGVLVLEWHIGRGSEPPAPGRRGS